MMEILKDFPDDVLAIHADGRVTQKDYDDVLIPAANAAFTLHPKLRVYYETGPGFSGFEVGAMWKDFTYGVGHLTGWERIALVTDVDWIKHMANAFRFLMPCPVKLFTPDESTQARQWIAQS